MIIDILFVLTILIITLLNVVIRSIAKTSTEKTNGAKLSGFEIAKKIAKRYGKEEVHIIKKNGKFLDYYDIERNTIKLSKETFDGEDMYAAAVALNIALETKPENKNTIYARKINAFLVIASYVMIIIGSIANHMLLIRLGMILFVIAYVIEFALLAKILGTEEEVEELHNYIKKEKLIKPFEDYEEEALILSLARLATFPYNFIVYFR